MPLSALMSGYGRPRDDLPGAERVSQLPRPWLPGQPRLGYPGRDGRGAEVYPEQVLLRQQGFAVVRGDLPASRVLPDPAGTLHSRGGMRNTHGIFRGGRPRGAGAGNGPEDLATHRCGAGTGRRRHTVYTRGRERVRPGHRSGGAAPEVPAAASPWDRGGLHPRYRAHSPREKEARHVLREHHRELRRSCGASNTRERGCRDGRRRPLPRRAGYGETGLGA